jgi:hypothetical protein
MTERKRGGKHRRRCGLTARRWLPISKFRFIFCHHYDSNARRLRCRRHRSGGRLREPIPSSWIGESLRQWRLIRRRRRGSGACLGDRSNQRREQAHTRALRNRDKSYQCRSGRSCCHSKTPKPVNDRAYGSDGRPSGRRYGFSAGDVHGRTRQSRRCGEQTALLKHEIDLCRSVPLITIRVIISRHLVLLRRHRFQAAIRSYCAAAHQGQHGSYNRGASNIADSVRFHRSTA